MTDVPRFGSYDDTPIYTIKTVVQETGIPPATLRAWERRYGVLSPARSQGGYRLYAERDIAILRWLKRQLDAGVSISRAVALLEMRHEEGREGPRPRGPEPELPAAGARSPAMLTQELTDALLAFQENRAESLLGEALALYAVEEVAGEVIAEALIEIGERWHRGEASVVQEHFATALLHRRLSAIFQAYGQPAAGPLAITGAAPFEWHDVGILLVSMALRRHGWRVIYLGQNVPADHLVQEVRHLRPQLVCVSAATPEGTQDLARLHEAISQLPPPRPRLIFGGRAFNLSPELRARFADSYIGPAARDLITYLAPP